MQIKTVYDEVLWEGPERTKRQALEKAKGGSCPYDGINLTRSAYFRESRELYSPGPSKSAYELMTMLLAEKCGKKEGVE